MFFFAIMTKSHAKQVPNGCHRQPEMLSGNDYRIDNVRCNYMGNFSEIIFFKNYF